MAEMLAGILQNYKLPDTAVKRAAVSTAALGDNTLVAAVTGKRIKVLALVLCAAAAVDVRLESGAGGTALTGVMSLAAGDLRLVWPLAVPGYHWVETAAGALLNMELGGAVQVSGCIVYYEE
jgi:hypothetical protein